MIRARIEAGQRRDTMPEAFETLLRSMRLLRERVESFEQYPYSIPAPSIDSLALISCGWRTLAQGAVSTLDRSGESKWRAARFGYATITPLQRGCVRERQRRERRTDVRRANGRAMPTARPIETP